MAAPVSSSFSATRTPLNVSFSSPSPWWSQVYYAPLNVPGSSYSPSFSVSISISKSYPFFLHQRLDKRSVRFIHGQVCRSLSFSFHSVDSTEDTSMEGLERASVSQHLAGTAIRTLNKSILPGKEKFENFGPDNKVRVHPSLSRRKKNGLTSQKTIISEGSRLQSRFNASRSNVESDMLRNGVDSSKLSSNEDEKQRYLPSQKHNQVLKPQKYVSSQSSRSQNQFYASRVTVELEHGIGVNESEFSGNGQDNQLSLYNNQLIENGDHSNHVDSLKNSANKPNQRSFYSNQQIENGQGNCNNPPLNCSASKQEKPMSLYRKNQQMDNAHSIFHNPESRSSIGADNNGEQSTVYSSKLEEILAKFKKKPGFHKDPRVGGVVGTENDSHSQHVEAEMVQGKDVMLSSKEEVRQGSGINLNALEGGNKIGQHYHKKGRNSLIIDETDRVRKDKSFLEEDDGRNSSGEKSLFNFSGSSNIPRKSKRHTSLSIGSRSRPSRASVPSSNAMGRLQNKIPSMEQDDMVASSREKSPLNLSDRSNIPWKAKRQHSSINKLPIQSKTGRPTPLSTGSHSSHSRTEAPSSDAKSPRSDETHKLSVKESLTEEDGNQITKSKSRIISGDMPQVDIPNGDFRNPVNEMEIDTSDPGDEYDYSWSTDSDDDGSADIPIQHHCSNKTTPGNEPLPSFSSEVMDSNMPSSSVDKPTVATWHKHSIPDIPFEFQYSYTETPNTPIVRYRETPFSPFGPSTMGRPWTGRAPLKPSKKKLPEFDSFKPPPKGKKGIKFVQDPGPFPKGESPKPSKTREEIMGEPLSKEEIIELVEESHKERRQLNLGRDGLTHNMLDLIHCHWKRRRVCKIKCIGVPTLDMNNVCFHVEDKTGGKIIYQSGGILYLYRGRNYNYKDRPKIPIMLWKPVTPVYAKLIQAAPVGLTKEEANKLRQLGEKVEPMCKLGKNGVYLNLVEDTRVAFKIDELVRIDCRGLNPSDYKKIGAKLKDLVPCVLLSFDNEHILMWKGKENNTTVANTEAPQEDDSLGQNAVLEDAHEDEILSPSITLDMLGGSSESESFADGNSMLEPEEVSIPTSHDIFCELNDTVEQTILSEGPSLMDAVSDLTEEENGADPVYNNGQSDNIVLYIDDLWKGAIASGMALELNVDNVDNDELAKKACELAKSAPIGPSYTARLISKLKLKTPKIRKPDELRINFGKPKKKQNQLPYRPYKTHAVDVPQSGGLPVTELARLLASR